MARRRRKTSGPSFSFAAPLLLVFALYQADPTAFQNVVNTITNVAMLLAIFVITWLLLRTIKKKTPTSTHSSIAPNKLKAAPDGPFLNRTEPVLRNLRSESRASKDASPSEWTLELLQSLEWKRFEVLCEAYFKTKNLDARVTEVGPDGGVDIRLYEHNSDNLFALMQCKAWSGNVGVKPVRELYGVMASEGINKGIFLSSGVFTDEAVKFSNGKGLRLISGPMLLNAIRKLDAGQQQELMKVAAYGDYKTPTCPNCDIKLTARNGRRGPFWGCQNFPRCRYTAPMKKSASKTQNLTYC